jgi:hypothetical protein
VKAGANAEVQWRRPEGATRRRSDRAQLHQWAAPTISATRAHSLPGIVQRASVRSCRVSRCLLPAERKRELVANRDDACRPLRRTQRRGRPAVFRRLSKAFGIRRRDPLQAGQA